MNRMKAHPRVFWHRLKDHVRRFGWIWLAVFLILSLVNNRWHLAMNRSHSLPFKLFVIERGQKDVKVGDYVAFEPKPSAVGGYRLTFIKEVVCGPGQTLTRENRTFYCDGKELTTAKKRALNGNPLEATQPQVLGEDQYFVRGTHKDSYDSRYESFGLIDRCRFSGRALFCSACFWHNLVLYCFGIRFIVGVYWDEHIKRHNIGTGAGNRGISADL